MITYILIAYAALTLPLVGYISVKVYLRVKRGPVEERSAAAQIIDVVRACNDTAFHCWQNVAQSQSELRRDSQAMLQATQAIAITMMEIKDIARAAVAPPAPTPQKGVEFYINALEYARDNYARTKGQKGAVEGVINIIKHRHGAGTK